MNRFIKIFLLFVVTLLTTNMAHAQSIAGDDKHIPFKVDENNNLIEVDPVNLTAKSGAGNCCFEWSTGDGVILSDPEQQSITVKPVYPHSTFTVKRTCSDGVVSGSVTVYYDDFTIISITPKYECYPAGEQVQVSDYTIVTDPAGFQDHVANVTKNYIKENQKETSMTVQFQKKAGAAQIFPTNVNVVNGDFGPFSTEVNVGGVFDVINALAGKVNNIFDKIDKGIDLFLSGSKVLPCEFKIDEPKTAIKWSDRKLCCRDIQEEGYAGKKVTNFQGSITMGGGTQCDLFIAGLPGIASINGRIGWKISTIFGLTLEPKCTELKICMPATIKLEGRAGFSVTGLNGALLDAAAVLVVAGSVEDKLCLFPVNIANGTDPKITLDVGKFCFSFKAEFSLTAISFFKINKEIPIIDKCTPPLSDMFKSSK